MRDDIQQAESRADLARALRKIEAGFASRTKWLLGANLTSAATVVAVQR